MKIAYIDLKLVIAFFLFEHFIFITYFHNKFKNDNNIEILTNSTSNENKMDKDSLKELKSLQKYIDIIFNGTLIDKEQIYYPTNNPKISVIISIYNGEGFIKTALLSIQNQDFKDIEIIFVDDGSKDNSVKLIKELKLKEPRIILHENIENRGILYTKTKGVLLSKGKYILLLDEDDIYGQRDAFSTLYKEAEKNNLDLLSFNWIWTKPKIKNIIYRKSKKEFPIMYQPELGEKMFKRSKDGKIHLHGGLLTNYFIKRDILVKIIKDIDEKYLKEKMIFHDDFMLYFLLTRQAYNYKKIDRLFYVILRGWNETNIKINFRIKEKNKNRKFMRCDALLTFIQFLLEKTKNTIYDKKIAFYCLNRWLLKYWCRNFTETTPKAINISIQFLKNKYILDLDKEKIKLFLEEKNYTFKSY